MLKDTHILQGSVATHLRYGGIFSDSIITNFLLILIVKLLWKLVNIWFSCKAYNIGANFGVTLYTARPYCNFTHFQYWLGDGNGFRFRNEQTSVSFGVMS